MPTITAKREGPCGACRLPIYVGEQIDFTREKGARHLACVEQEPTARTNLYRARCHWCSAWVAKGKGKLSVVETQQGGSYVRRNIVACADSAACSARCKASLVHGLPHRPQRRGAG